MLCTEERKMDWSCWCKFPVIFKQKFSCAKCCAFVSLLLLNFFLYIWGLLIYFPIYRSILVSSTPLSHCRIMLTRITATQLSWPLFYMQLTIWAHHSENNWCHSLLKLQQTELIWCEHYRSLVTLLHFNLFASLETMGSLILLEWTKCTQSYLCSNQCHLHHQHIISTRMRSWNCGCSAQTYTGSHAAQGGLLLTPAGNRA